MLGCFCPLFLFYPRVQIAKRGKKGTEAARCDPSPFHENLPPPCIDAEKGNARICWTNGKRKIAEMPGVVADVTKGTGNVQRSLSYIQNKRSS